MAKPIFFGVAIIFLVYVPILTLGGVEGKLFKPMAATVLFALLASLVIALTLMPVLSWYVLRKQNAEKQTWIMRKMDRLYRPTLKRALRSPFWTGGIAFAIFTLSLIAIPFLGAEFIPSLDEGSILVQMYCVPGISISESLHGNQIIETVLRGFPEVSQVFSRTGSPEVATDPMAIDQSDVYVALKPKDQWPTSRTKNELIAVMQKRLNEEAPGAVYSFSQPIQMRMQELTEGGSRSDIATNHAEQIDRAVLSRFQERLAIPLPDLHGRERLLTVLLQKKRLSFALEEGSHTLAAMSEGKGLSGRDLKSWIGRAEQKALLRAIATGGPQHFALTLDDFDSPVTETTVTG